METKKVDQSISFIYPSAELCGNIDGVQMVKDIEKYARLCYKSEGRITEDSYKKFVASKIKLGHESVIEHCSVVSKIICDRGVSHELVRHRLFSFSQESTRYCNYGKRGMTFIIPPWFSDDEHEKLFQVSSVEELHTVIDTFSTPTSCFLHAILDSYNGYNLLLSENAYKPEQARGVLPNSIKTELMMTGNLRNWRHFFKLRTDKAAHPQMIEIADILLTKMKDVIPIIFDDIK